MRRAYVQLTLTFLLLWVLGCQQDDPTLPNPQTQTQKTSAQTPASGGSGSDVEDRFERVSAVVVDTNLQVLCGAEVRWRSQAYLPSEGTGDSTPPNAITDSLGHFSFLPPDTLGAYLEIAFHDTLGRFIHVVPGKVRYLPDTLKILPFTTVTGKLSIEHNAGHRVRISAYGCDRSVVADTGGHFRFRGPPGEYVLSIHSDSTSSIRPYEIEVLNSGPGRDLGRIPLPTPCSDFACDTTVTRKLLHENGLDSLPLMSLMDTASGRVVALRLRGKGLNHIPFSISEIAGLTELDLGENQIFYLPPSLGQLINLKSIWLDGNRIKDVSHSIRSLTHLEWLDLSNNQISTLSPGMLQLPNNLKANLSNNLLCALDSELLAWADRVSPGWRATQLCDPIP